MKSPKNVVKALLLTSLIVSSISAMGDAESFALDAVNAGRQVAAGVAAPAVAQNVAPVAASKWDSVKGFFTATIPGFCTSIKDAAVNNPKTSAGVAGAVATLGGLKYYGFKNAWNKVKAAAVSVKDTIVEYKKTSATVVATAVAATGAAAYFCPEQRQTVVNGLTSGLGWAWDKTKSFGSTLWEHKGKTAAAVTVPALGYGVYSYLNPAKPAGEVVSAAEPTEQATDESTLTESTSIDTTPAELSRTTQANRAQHAVNLANGLKPYQTSDLNRARIAQANALERARRAGQKPTATTACPTGRCGA